MSKDIEEQKIHELGHELWRQAGSPPGREEEFWRAAKDRLLKEEGHTDVDAASEQSFPASDPVNHM